VQPALNLLNNEQNGYTFTLHMITGKKFKHAMSGSCIKEKAHAELSVGDAVRIARELNELSQNELAEATGLSQSIISGIENGRINLGAERAKTLARALSIHPATLLFPNWDTESESAA
jgi:ribosome-binding protein aMBF1 (putative translation factor)